MALADLKQRDDILGRTTQQSCASLISVILMQGLNPKANYVNSNVNLSPNEAAQFKNVAEKWIISLEKSGGDQGIISALKDISTRVNPDGLQIYKEEVRALSNMPPKQMFSILPDAKVVGDQKNFSVKFTLSELPKGEFGLSAQDKLYLSSTSVNIAPNQVLPMLESYAKQQLTKAPKENLQQWFAKVRNKKDSKLKLDSLSITKVEQPTLANGQTESNAQADFASGRSSAKSVAAPADVEATQKKTERKIAVTPKRVSLAMVSASGMAASISATTDGSYSLTFNIKR